MLEVSVVIPVFNDLKAIKLTLKALRNQTYPSDRFEIIIIDNGSSDGTREWLRKQQDIILLQESNHIESPYSARNRGIEISKSEIIVLLDSTCFPQNNWMEMGIRFFKKMKCDFFSGDVKFNFGNKHTAAKIYDSITNVQVKDSVIKRRCSQTANLWVRRYLFEKQGLFEEGVRSGEDISWTSRAVKAGYILSFSETVIVYKLARELNELLAKKIRVGKGQILIWQKEGTLKKMFTCSFKKILPVKPLTFISILQRYENNQLSYFMKIKIYLVSYLDNLATLYGNIIGFKNIRKVKKHGDEIHFR